MAVYHNQTIKEVKSIAINAILDNNQEVTLQFDIKDGRPVCGYDGASISIVDHKMTLSFDYSAFEMKVI